MLKPPEGTVFAMDHYNNTDLEVYTGVEFVFYASVI